MVSYSDLAVLGQASFNPSVDGTDPQINLIEQWRTSERGDRRAAVALPTIGQECAELDRLDERHCDDPALKDCTVDLVAISAARNADTSSFYRTPPSGGPSPARTWALIARMKAKRAARVRIAHPRTKPVRSGARQVRSPATHGGSRKAGDDGDGGDGGPPGTTPLFVSLPKPRRGYRFINANCECWRQQISNLFCTKCAPVDRRDVSREGGSQ